MSEIAHKVLDKKSIIKQVIIALIIGTTLLVSAVLPAEYGIDPLGIGKATGFSKLYVPEGSTENLSSEPHKILKMENVGSPADVAKPDAANNPAPATQLAERTDDVSVVIPAGKGLEYKVNMLKYGQLKYEWITDKGELYFDFHGEVKTTATTLKATPLLIQTIWQVHFLLRLKVRKDGISKTIQMRTLLSKSK